MKKKFTPTWAIGKVGHWLLKNKPARRTYLCDFQQICKEVQSGDVLLVEGRNRISSIIKNITQSPWSHAMLCIGKLEDIENPEHRKKAKRYYKRTRYYKRKTSKTDLSGLLIIETDVGVGTIITAIEKYKNDHIRILRPQGILPEDIQKVIEYVISRLGTHYSFRHIFDLARLLLPWGFLPREWRSSLFEQNALKPTEDICSSMIAQAFENVNFPILPIIEKKGKIVQWVHRNPKLFTPSDFDYSPYFSVIKYPILPSDKNLSYRDLPWGVIKDKKDEIR